MTLLHRRLRTGCKCHIKYRLPSSGSTFRLQASTRIEAGHVCGETNQPHESTPEFTMIFSVGKGPPRENSEMVSQSRDVLVLVPRRVPGYAP